MKYFDCALNREKYQKIGDLMKTFAPFLKLYTDYVKNFDTAMNIISTWSVRCARFAAIMDEVQVCEKRTESTSFLLMF